MLRLCEFAQIIVIFFLTRLGIRGQAEGAFFVLPKHFKPIYLIFLFSVPAINLLLECGADPNAVDHVSIIYFSNNFVVLLPLFLVDMLCFCRLFLLETKTFLRIDS